MQLADTTSNSRICFFFDFNFEFKNKDVIYANFQINAWSDSTEWERFHVANQVPIALRLPDSVPIYEY